MESSSCSECLSEQAPSLDVLSDAFMRRGDCGAWHELWAWVYAVSNLAITAAYVLIPAILIWTLLTAKSLGPELLSRERSLLQATYAAFILFCGLGHLEGMLAFVWPRYHLFAAWHALTALVSWHAVLMTFLYRLRLVGGFV